MATTEEETRTSLERMQTFDASSLPREKQLGAKLAFTDAVAPAEKLIRLFRQIPLSLISEFPDNQLGQIKEAADATFNLLQQIDDFDVEKLGGQSAIDARNGLIQQLKRQYAQVFTTLYPLVAFAGAISTDFGRLESEGRAAIQSVKDEAGRVVGEMESAAQQAEEILSNVRKVAEEQGVSQQAFFFKTAAEHYEESAARWRTYTIRTAIALGAFAVFTIFAHKIPWLRPANSLEAAQFIVGKLLLFAVITYMLVLCARNFLAKTHNALVNQHRQNALATFKALADAAHSDDQRDVVLTHASACIFSPQETGFTKAAGGAPGPSTLIEMLPRLVASTGHGG